MTRFLVLVAVFLAAGAIAEEPKGEYVFVPDTERLVGISKGNALLIGKLDANGEFYQTDRYEVQSPKIPVIVYSGPTFTDLNTSFVTPRKVYELRSGMLIPGTIETSDLFVPEEDGKIIKFSNYKYGPDARHIWNLPGRFELKKK